MFIDWIIIWTNSNGIEWNISPLYLSGMPSIHPSIRWINSSRCRVFETCSQLEEQKRWVRWWEGLRVRGWYEKFLKVVPFPVARNETCLSVCLSANPGSEELRSTNSERLAGWIGILPFPSLCCKNKDNSSKKQRKSSSEGRGCITSDRQGKQTARAYELFHKQIVSMKTNPIREQATV